MSLMTSSYKISTNQKSILFFEANDKTLLDCLDKNNIASEYNCKEGFCGACRTTLISGSVLYNIEPLASIRSDEILTCCSKPNSDIQIDI